jgi:DNA-3-methyladenine glycosylase I
MDKKRCWGSSQLMIDYHDKEWGVPLHDDRKIFEFLVLESMQAGLSWDIVLRKRENFRKAFHNFNVMKIAKYGEKDVRRLLNNDGIIRNRMKLEAVINNARRFLEVQKEFGTFDRYIWQFTGGKPMNSRLASLKKMKATSMASDKMSKDLKRRGFKFVGSTICYAHMQATGMVNDHLTSCFRHGEVGR